MFELPNSKFLSISCEYRLFSPITAQSEGNYLVMLKKGKKENIKSSEFSLRYKLFLNSHTYLT